MQIIGKVLMDFWLSVVTAMASLIAAGFWAASAIVKLPTLIASGYGGVGGSAQQLGDAVRRQSMLSAFGAVFACIAALAQCIQVWIRVSA